MGVFILVYCIYLFLKMWIISIQIYNPDAQDARNDQMYVGSQSLAFKVVYDKSFYTHYRSINHWPETEYVARAVFTLYGKKQLQNIQTSPSPPCYEALPLGHRLRIPLPKNNIYKTSFVLIAVTVLNQILN